jgi:hypothetical protein
MIEINIATSDQQIETILERIGHADHWENRQQSE